MAKFLKSLNTFECYVEKAGVLIPKKRYFNSSANVGKKNIVSITDEQLELLKQDRVILAMLKSGKLLVLDVLPEEYKDSAVKQAELVAENKDLKEKLEKANAKLTRVK